jgi:hypothetical protein
MTSLFHINVIQYILSVYFYVHIKVNIVFANVFKNNVEVLQVRTLHELKRIKWNLQYVVLLNCKKLYSYSWFKETVLQGFFVNQFPPSLSIPLRPFRIFSTICGDIRKSICTTGVFDTGGKFATCINNTSSTGCKFTAVVVILASAPRLANISANFRKHVPNDSWKKPDAKDLVTLSLY